MKKIFIILPFLLLISCSVQKRKYQKGFYVNANTNKTISKKENIDVSSKKNDQATTKKETIFQKPENNLILMPIEKAKQTEASSDQSVKSINPVKYPSLTSTKDVPCDKITLKNGDEVSAKVLEITAIEVKYQKCGVENSPLYIIKKSNVFMITYANGSKDVFKDEVAKNQDTRTPNQNYYNAITNENATISLILGICGIVIGVGSIPAIIFGNNAIREIKGNPGKYNNESSARIGLVLGAVGLAIKILLLIIILLVLASII